MKMRIAKTFNLDAEEFRACVLLGKDCGHNYDDCKDREIVRRLLTDTIEARIVDAVGEMENRTDDA